MLELGGGDAYAYGLLGFAYTAKQDFQPAEVAYRNALLLQPENTEWRLGLTRCVVKQEKFEDAAALLDVLIARYPDKAEFWLLQAQTFLGMKKPLEAAQNFEAVDRLGKATQDSLHTLGDIYVTENLSELAARAYVRAIDVDTNQPLARPLRSAQLLAARGAMTGHASWLRIREVWRDRIETTDQRALLKLRSAHQHGRRRGHNRDGIGTRGDREARSPRRRCVDAARPALFTAERARSSHLLLRTRRGFRCLRGQRQGPPRAAARDDGAVLRRRALAPERSGGQAA
jgi:tetratricopeptide (TPR) repeat protein